MATYRVNLCLTITATNTPTTFGNRFPKAKAYNWWNLQLPANDTNALKPVINAQILTDCRTDIESDLGMTGALAVIAFDATTTWNPLGGGQHEYTSRPIYVDYGGVNPVPWRFTGDTGQKYQMNAGVRFYDI